ncbi:MAG: hypothetical protein OXJ52_04395 [Oligoflexia bacterium]|nr:hypothetical protein [Oligoflexia bacterium]
MRVLSSGRTQEQVVLKFWNYTLDFSIFKDFLSWKPKNKKYVCIGNPPFGYRAWLAIKFLNHCSIFSDYVGFILPMSFQSEVRGSPKLRIKGMKLIHSEKLPNDSFENIDDQTMKMNTLWQVWEKGIKKNKFKRFI